MENSTAEFADRNKSDYDGNGGSVTGNADLLRVIVPSQPPEFTPEAARALLRLFASVRGASEKATDQESVEEK